MEGVVHHPHRRVVDRLNKFYGLGDARQEIIFKPVEILNRNRHSGLGRMVGHFLHGLNAPLKFVVSWALTRKLANGRVGRTAKHSHARRPAAVERTTQGIDSGPTHTCRRADWIVAGTAHGDGSPLKTNPVERLAPLLVERFIEFEDRHLNAVVTQSLDPLHNRRHALVHPVGPQKKIEAVFHARGFQKGERRFGA